MTQTNDKSVTLLLSPRNAPAGLLSGPSGRMVFYALPLSYGFQMPLPESGREQTKQVEVPDHDWHCYLGSR
ncbi:hypothetical protein Dehly_1216 [Dehalogenimonas lykanthroporepellens BL-DC-9]|nr:hypothetical protein Dehly_1216 [Dehalogenimonas lykanthroporepellens BL-DC-9]